MQRSPSFLFICVFVFAGQLPESSAAVIRGGDCRRGAVVIGVFYENPCQGDENPFPKLRKDGQHVIYSPPVTVAKVRDYLTRYCSFAMPEVRRCFANFIGGCDEGQQQYLNNLALTTSDTCQSNSTDISPWVDYVLTRLTDEDVAINFSCPHDIDHLIRGDCRETARNVSGLSSYNETYLHSASVQDLLPLVQSYYSTQLECQIRGFRDHPDHCSYWRLTALESVLSFTGPPPLGLRLNYTEAQIGEMFGFSDRRRHSDSFPFLP